MTSYVDPTTVVIAMVLYFAVIAGFYVWGALALSKVFAKLDVASWKAWIPFLNIIEVLKLGGREAWNIVWFFVPIANIYGLILLIGSIHQINLRFGKGAGMTVLAVLVFPVWASILGFGPDRPIGAGDRRIAGVPWGMQDAAAGSVPPPPGSSSFGAPATPPAYPAAPLPNTQQNAWPLPPAPSTPLAPPLPSVQQSGWPAPAPAAPPLPPAAPKPVEPVFVTAPPPSVVRPPVAPPPFASASVTAPPAPPVPPTPPVALVAPPVSLTTPPQSPAPAADNRWAPTSAPQPGRLPAVDPESMTGPRGVVTPAPAFDAGDEDERTIVVNRTPVVKWNLVTTSGERLRLAGDTIILGRKPTVADGGTPIAVPDTTKTLSRVHARLTRDDDVWTITDLNATNGVIMIDAGGTETALAPGASSVVTSAFILGEVRLSIEFDA